MNFFNNSCGGGCSNGFGFGGGCDSCSLLLWLIILQCLCGGGNGGCGLDCCTIILLLLLLGSCGNGCGK